MAAASPLSAVSNNSSDTNTTSPATATATASTSATNPSLTPSINSSKNLRGLNKPKCIKCGNVARSRCPYQSCKSCCAKAQNPCHIHVLKGSLPLPDKVSSSGSPRLDPQSTEVPQSGNSHRSVSFRQLSSTFAQFNNLPSPLRSRKPLTRKDAQVINEWRFLKLKEFKDSKIEAENRAFDRYIRNVSLLEEIFSGNSSVDGQTKDGSPTEISNTSVDEISETEIAAQLKLKLRSDTVRTENLRKRMQHIVDQGFKKRRNFELNEGAGELSDPDELGNRPKKESCHEERVSGLSDLIDKLNKSRNEEDLKACWEMKSLLFDHSNRLLEPDDTEALKDRNLEDDTPPPKQQSLYSPPKWFCTATIDQEALSRVDAHFSSIEEREEL